MTSVRFRLPRPGLAVRRHARRLGRPPGGARRRSTRRRPRSARTSARLIREGPKEQLDLTDQHPAGDADRRHRLLSRLARRDAAPRRRSSPATRSANTRALVAAGALTLRRRAAAGALSRPGDAGGGAGRRRRDGGDPRPRRRRGRAGCAEAARETGEVVEAANFNDPKQTVIAGTQGRRRAGLRAAEGGGRQARAAAAGVGAVPFER